MGKRTECRPQGKWLSVLVERVSCWLLRKPGKNGVTLFKMSQLEQFPPLIENEGPVEVLEVQLQSELHKAR